MLWCEGEELEVGRRDEAFFVAGADFDPATASCGGEGLVTSLRE